MSVRMPRLDESCTPVACETVMARSHPITDPTRRHGTRYRGISYRERADGTRTYSVYFRGRYVGVDGGEKEALAKQADKDCLHCRVPPRRGPLWAAVSPRGSPPRRGSARGPSPPR